MDNEHAKFINASIDYCAANAIPTIHEAPTVESGEDVEVRRLRVDIHLMRSHLDTLAGPHPDGRCMDDEQSYERRWAVAYGCGHPKDPGHTMSRLDFLARSYGLDHIDVTEVLRKLDSWEARLPVEFEAVRSEFLAWRRESLSKQKMFRDWTVEEPAHAD